MNRRIPITVSDEYITGQGVVVGAAGSHDDVDLEIHFGSMWNGLSLQIVWLNSHGENAVTTIVSSSMYDSAVGAYVVPIPPEPKEFSGDMFFTIKGFQVSNNVESVATLTAYGTGVVMESLWDNGESQAISPTVAAQLQAEVDNVYTKAQSDEKYVEKIAGKELSTNDYNNTDKANLNANTAARHTHDNKSALDTIPSGGVVTQLIASNDVIPTAKAVVDAMSEAGGGDMMKAAYDTERTGNKVDTAKNAEKLNGQDPSYYAQASNVYTKAETKDNFISYKESQTLTEQEKALVRSKISAGGFVAQASEPSANDRDKLWVDIDDEYMTASPYNFMGSCTYAELPASATINDTYYVTDRKYRMTWNGTAWYQSSLDESDYEDELSQLSESIVRISEDVNDENYVPFFIENSYVSNTDGTIINYANWKRTDFLPVSDELYVYTEKSLSKYNCFYDADKVFVSNFSLIAGDNTVTVPDNAKYVIISGSNANMVNVKVKHIYHSQIAKIKKDIGNIIYGKSNGSNVVDQKEEIERILNQYGEVNLAKGTFYVSQIEMPTGSTIRGTGEDTIICVYGFGTTLSDTSAIKALGNNTIENVTICTFNYTHSRPTTSSYGTVDGIRILNEASLCRITNCNIYGFDRAGIYVNTVGHDSCESYKIDGCKIMYCKVGIYLAYRAEYGVVANTWCNSCYVGIRNDSGNNLLIGCHFDLNVVGYMCDVTGLTSANDGHGSAVGCTFNHNDTYAVYQRQGTNGYIFDACQMYYGAIYLRSANGIAFIGCQMDNKTIWFRGGSGFRFVNNTFYAQPTFSVESTEPTNVVCKENYTLAGVEIEEYSA